MGREGDGGGRARAPLRLDRQPLQGHCGPRPRLQPRRQVLSHRVHLRARPQWQIGRLQAASLQRPQEGDGRARHEHPALRQRRDERPLPRVRRQGSADRARCDAPRRLRERQQLALRGGPLWPVDERPLVSVRRRHDCHQRSRLQSSTRPCRRRQHPYPRSASRSTAPSAPSFARTAHCHSPSAALSLRSSPSAVRFRGSAMACSLTTATGRASAPLRSRRHASFTLRA